MVKVRPLSPDLQKIAITELNEDPDNISKEIASIRQWVTEQPELGKYQLSDQFILNFLRACKHNDETVYKKLPNFLTMALLCPEILANRRVDDDMMDLIRSGFHLPLSMTNNDLTRIHLIKYSKIDLKNHTIHQGFKLMYMILEVDFLENDNTAVAGFTAIEDLSDISFGHVFSLNLLVFKRMLDFVRCGFPHRIKGVHIINAPWFAVDFCSMVRKLLPAKLKNRFFVHRKIEDLYEYVPQKLLPAEYGGENETVDDVIKCWERKMQQYGEYFEHDLKFGTDFEHKA